MKNNVYEQSTKPMLRYLAISFVLFISFIFSVSNLSAQGGTWEEITYDNFESGWGNFVDGGSYCDLYNNSAYAHDGNYSLRLGYSGGKSYSQPIDIYTEGYSKLKIDFWFRTRGFDSSDDFFLEYWDGDSWLIIETYEGTDYSNSTFYSSSVTITNSAYQFPYDARIRFHCSASSSSEYVYIDEVTISALPPVEPPPVENWQQLTYDSFETGWGNFIDGGSYCYRVQDDNYSYQGDYSLRLSDDYSKSYTIPLDVETDGYTDIKVEFWFHTIGFDSGEGFYIDYWDGDTWSIIKYLEKGNNFNNTFFHFEKITISNTTYTFPQDARIRIRCNSSSSSEYVYIDEVTISALPPVEPPPVENWQQLTYDSFETGWGNFVDGGSYCDRIHYANRSYQGNYSLRLAYYYGKSYSQPIDIYTEGYTQLKIDFWFHTYGFDNGDDFYVEYWDGNSWNTIENLISGTDFSSSFFNFESIIITNTSYTFPQDAKIRFTCSASSSREKLYLDEIKIYGLLPPSVESINLEPSMLEILTVNSFQLNSIVSPTDAGDQTVSWASANETIATVDATGLVTGVAEGTTTVTATTNDGGFTDQAVVHVFSHGDVNKDRYVGAFDAGIVLQHSVGNPTDDWGVSTPWTSFETSAADVDIDETVTATDASYILQYVAGMISSLPVPAKKSAEKPQISYEIQENAFVLYAGQEVFGLNLSVKAEGTTIQLPEILVQDVLSATNQKEESYLIGLAAVNPVPAGTPLARIPFEQEQGVVVFDINMNGLSATLSHAFSSITAIEKGDNPGFSCEVSPNPVQSSCLIRLFNPVPAESCVRIYSMNGRLVKQLYKGTPVGNLHLEWDRTNMNNHAAPAGMYIYAVINGKSRLTGKLICR